MKPAKILYEDQEDVWNKARKRLLQILAKCKTVEEAYVWASLAEGQFGLYEQPYRNQLGSDIDLVVVMREPPEIPKDWNFTKVEKKWFDLYDIGFFEYEGNIHKIDGLIVIPSKHDLAKMKEALEGRSKRIL
ncbi:MAG: hypothetical protein JXA43_01050 [Candidatus Diapherotrites archaeon]|nr:hypothetical protein [Candidatus Diapherotrites archaeon]